MTGNIIAIVIGVAFVLIGMILTYVWKSDFVVLVRGSLGVTLIFVGLLAAVIGWSELKATREFEAATSTPPSPEGPGEAQPTGGSESTSA